MKKRMIPILLGICLMFICVGVSYATSLNVVEDGNCGAEIGCFSEFDANSIGELGISHDGASVNAAASQADEPAFSSYQFEESYSEYETVLVPIDDTTYEVHTLEGEVLGILRENDGKSFPKAGVLHSINWTLRSGMLTHGTQYAETSNGKTCYFAMKAEPTGASKFGFYVYNQNAYYWIIDSWSSTINNSFTFNGSYGLVAPALCNMSTKTISYTGWWTD